MRKFMLSAVYGAALIVISFNDLFCQKVLKYFFLPTIFLPKHTESDNKAEKYACIPNGIIIVKAELNSQKI